MILQSQKTNSSYVRERGLSFDDSNREDISHNLKPPPFASLGANTFHPGYRFGHGLDLSGSSGDMEMSLYNS